KYIVFQTHQVLGNEQTCNSLPQVTLFLQNEIIQSGMVQDGAGHFAPTISQKDPVRQSSRAKMRKLFFDEESDITDIVKILKTHDSNMRVTFGEQIIVACKSMKPLPPKLKRHLVKICCEDLIKKCHSNHPSTDQREQLAECIVSQLYPTLTGKENLELKNSYYDPSTTVTDVNTGKKRSLSPTGYIQYFFKNFWTTIRKNVGTTCESLPDAILDEALDDFEASSIEEGQEMQRWLCNHSAPPQKVFDYLTKTFSLRRKDILKCRANLEFEAFLKQWPRLMDTPGA
ncbi:unnamed protein product, partial [Allacma fusca]